MTPRRNIVFVGPVYPPDYIMDCIDYIKTSMSLDDLSEDSPGYYIPYISDLRVDGSDVWCRVTSSNPITGDVFSKDISTKTREIGYKGTQPISYTSSNSFNISPCCVINSVDTRGLSPRTVYIPEAQTVVCSASQGRLGIDVVDSLPIIGMSEKDYDYSVNQGIKRINGISTENGNINIIGVGEVTITVAEASNNGN